jgi:hypothetical protein
MTIMKYHINTVLTGSFFLLVFAGLAIAHFNGQETDPQHNSAAEIENQPLDLPTIMRLLLIDINTINEGIYTQNFVLIEQGAVNINDHPPLSPETRKLVQNTLGDRMEQFGAYDKVVHGTADSLRQAAVKQDINKVMQYYNVIQQGCVSCHASFQYEVKQARLLREGSP